MNEFHYFFLVPKTLQAFASVHFTSTFLFFFFFLSILSFSCLQILFFSYSVFGVGMNGIEGMCA